MATDIDTSGLPPLIPHSATASSIYSLHEQSSTPIGMLDRDAQSSSTNWYTELMADYETHLSEDRVHVLLLDYLVTAGYESVARVLVEEMRDDLNIAIPTAMCDEVALAERAAIRAAVLVGDLDAAIARVERLCPQLLARDKQLSFDILRQKLVELIRVKDIETALQFAQSNLVDTSEYSEQQLAKIEQTYALLAFDAPEASPFGCLMAESQRLVLAAQINAAVLTELGASAHSRIARLQQAMVWNKAQIAAGGPANITEPLDAAITHAIARELFGTRDTAIEIDDEASSP